MAHFGRTTFTILRLRGGSGSYLLLPVLTTTQRDALSAATGEIVFNSTTGQLEVYNGSVWLPVPYPLVTSSDMAVGNLFHPPFWSSGGGASRRAGSMYYCPIFLSVPMTFDRIGLYVETAAGAGKKALLGCYRHTNGAPGALQFDAGEISIAATGLQLASISQQLTPGWWWLVCALETAVTVYTGGPLVFPWLPSAIAALKCYEDAVAYPSPAVLPTTPPVAAADGSSYSPPWIYLRIKSIP